MTTGRDDEPRDPHEPGQARPLRDDRERREARAAGVDDEMAEADTANGERSPDDDERDRSRS